MKILPQGYVVNTIARTIRKDLIDGREAYWYLYEISTWSGYNEIGWIFGGYLLEFEQEKKLGFDIKLEQNLIKMNWVNRE